MRILSIDPAIRNTGYAVIEGTHQAPVPLEHGVISIPAKLSQSKALAAVSSTLTNLIKLKIKICVSFFQLQDLRLLVAGQSDPSAGSRPGWSARFATS